MSQLPPEKPQINKQQAIKELWKKAVLRWKLDDNQLEVYKLIQQTDKTFVVVGFARQNGKSYLMCTIAIEACLRTPNTIVKYVAPQVKSVKKIILPLIRQICSDAPASLVPKFKTHDHVIQFANGSEIQMAGTDNGHAESIRGTKAHLCIVDEAAFCTDLNHIVKSILLPTTTTTQGKIVLISTPPKSADHDFMEFIKRAKAEGTYIKKTIFDNPRLSKEEIDKLADAAGGFESVDFLREYMCEMRTDLNDAVVPEFTKELQAKIIREYQRPPFYDTYVAMDIGGGDATAVLFGYYDFRVGRLIIEDELVIDGKAMLSDMLAREIKRKEEQLWTMGIGNIKKPLIRVADDNNKILLNDLSGIHGINFVPVLKDDSIAALNNMRVLLRGEKIIINPRCVVLIHELENTIWNKARNNYTRAEGRHGDTIDALKYLCRTVNLTKNPYPADYDMSFLGTDVFSQEKPKPTQLEHQIKQIFTIKPRRPNRRW